MIDTHCHLNFKRLVKSVETIIVEAQRAGVVAFVVPGTDIDSSQVAKDLSRMYNSIYAAVGIHPHHVFELYQNQTSAPRHESILSLLDGLEGLLSESEKVVAIGEIGLDRHMYTETKYKNYTSSEEFFELQEYVFCKQLISAKTHGKSVIVHNRESTQELLSALERVWSHAYSSRMVFHCCEPNEELLRFAQERHIYIGVDGDVTYDQRKASFIRKVPIELLVLETDSPYLLPEPLRTQKLYPNVPAHLPLIADMVARIQDKSVEEVIELTTHNARTLFSISEFQSLPTKK